MSTIPLNAAFPMVATNPFTRPNIGSVSRIGQADDFDPTRSIESDLLACIDLLEGRFGQFVNFLPQEHETGTHYARHRMGQLGISRFGLYVRTLAAVYSSPPWRVIKRDGKDLSEAEQKRLTETYAKLRVDDALLKADEYALCTDNAMLWLDAEDPNREPLLHVWHGAHHRAVDYPPTAFAAQWNLKENLVLMRNGLKEWEYAFVPIGQDVPDRGQICKVRSGVAWVSNDYQTRRYRGSGRGIEIGGASIALLSDVFNPLGYLFAFKSMPATRIKGQVQTTEPVDRGGEEPSTAFRAAAVTLGPGRSVVQKADDAAQAGAMIEFLAPETGLTEAVDAAEFIVDQVQQCLGIPATLLDASNDTSGHQTEEARAALIEHRVRRSQIFRSTENQIATMVAEYLKMPRGVYTVDVLFVDPMTGDSLDKSEEEEQNGRGSNGESGSGPATKSGESAAE